MKLLLQAVCISHKKLPVSLLISIVNVESYLSNTWPDEYLMDKIENNALFVYYLIIDFVLIKGDSAKDPP